MNKVSIVSSEVENNSQDKKNPANEIDKVLSRIEPSLETNKFSKTEQKEIVEMVMQDARSDIESLAVWLNDRRLDIMLYEGDRPTKIEGLQKKDWQSDRNLGMTAATCDAYQATLLATNWNPDTLNFKSTKENEIDRKDDITEFSKWGLGRAEANVTAEVDDFIHNRITQGFSVFHTRWEVKYRWVDKRIPVYYGPGDRLPKGKKVGDIRRYDIKTEQVRFEKGIIENISNVEDFLTPAFGKTIQELPHCIHVLHLTGQDIMDFVDRNIFINASENMIEKLKGSVFDYRIKMLGKEKAFALGIKTPDNISDMDLRVFPVDVFCWYGEYEKNGKKERYRFHVEPITETFFAGKPLRKVPGCRSGKYPFAGGAFIRRPGFLRGKSLPRLIMNIMNALNNIFNQKSDFQYVENCPFGFHKPDENFDKQVFDMVPGTSFPTEDPKNINFPVLNRTMAWAEHDMNFLLEMLERMTGAASYFMSNSKGVSGTATRDAIINEKSETRFGIWVRRIGDDIAEAIDMWVAMYQDCAPPDLGERVIGPDGKKLFRNLSINDLQGEYTAYMAPDILSGSKTMKKQIFGIAYQMAQTNPWFNPTMNPRGHWQLTADTFKNMGMMDVENYMPEKPPVPPGDVSLVDRLWQEFSHGDKPEIDPKQNNMQILTALTQKVTTDLMLMDEEYRPNVVSYMIKLQVAAMQQMKDMQEQQIAQAMAAQTIHGINNGTGPQGDTAGTPQGKVFQPPAAANVAQPTGIVANAGPNPGSGVADRTYANAPMGQQ